jgi:alcohol dehydrogenase (NADP+)
MLVCIFSIRILEVVIKSLPTTFASLPTSEATMSSIPNEIPAMGVKAAKEEVALLTYPVKPLAATDADIIITYNGVCHSDVHMIDNDWGRSTYPLVPGHEIVGHVINVGSSVTNVSVGDAVCLGCIAQSCMTCKSCQEGLDNICPHLLFTYMGKTKDETGEHQHYGGFSSYMRTDARKLFKVPSGLAEEYVGPLMCAGVTVFEPIRHYLNGTDGSGKVIGVVGIGGLGHLAIQIAHKTGANVVAFSRGMSKEEFVVQMGADSLVDTTSADAMNAAAGTIDLLIITISGGSYDVNEYIKLLKPYGNL